MIDALFEFVVMIKDFILSLINGLATFFSSLFTIVGMTVGIGRWMPGFLVSFVTVAVALIVVLRIVGR